MPYIPGVDRREYLDAGGDPENVGELNYLITRRIDTWLVEQGVSYKNLNEAIGILDEALNFDVLPPEGDVGRVISNILSSFILRTRTKRREVKGVIRCAQLELYRRICAPYEDTKIDENEDVYTCYPPAVYGYLAPR